MFIVDILVLLRHRSFVNWKDYFNLFLFFTICRKYNFGKADQDIQNFRKYEFGTSSKSLLFFCPTFDEFPTNYKLIWQVYIKHLLILVLILILIRSTIRIFPFFLVLLLFLYLLDLHSLQDSWMPALNAIRLLHILPCIPN